MNGARKAAERIADEPGLIGALLSGAVGMGFGPSLEDKAAAITVMTEIIEQETGQPPEEKEEKSEHLLC